MNVALQIAGSLNAMNESATKTVHIKTSQSKYQSFYAQEQERAEQQAQQDVRNQDDDYPPEDSTSENGREEAYGEE